MSTFPWNNSNARFFFLFHVYNAVTILFLNSNFPSTFPLSIAIADPYLCRKVKVN